MKVYILSLALLCFTGAHLVSCSSDPKPVASAPAVPEEYDNLNGTWKPVTKYVTPPPHPPETPPMAKTKTAKTGHKLTDKLTGWLPWHKNKDKPAPKAKPDVPESNSDL